VKATLKDGMLELDMAKAAPAKTLTSRNAACATQGGNGANGRARMMCVIRDAAEKALDALPARV
jgi:hypothetical protein